MFFLKNVVAPFIIWGIVTLVGGYLISPWATIVVALVLGMIALNGVASVRGATWGYFLTVILSFYFGTMAGVLASLWLTHQALWPWNTVVVFGSAGAFVLGIYWQNARRLKSRR